VVQGSGTVVVSSGSLEVSSAFEQSTIGSVSVVGGVLKGPAQINVSGTFTGGGFGSIEVGALVLQAGATGSVSPGTASWLNLEKTTFKNEGTLTIGKVGGIVGHTGAVITNTGVLINNGEGSHGENHGLGGSAGTLNNTGTLKKTEGTGTGECSFAINNEGSILISTGSMFFYGGGSSGVKAPGSWSTSSEAKVVFNANEPITSLGAKVEMTGNFEVWTSTVTAGQIEGAAATITATNPSGGFTGGTLEVNGPAPSTVRDLVVSAQSEPGHGWLTGSGEIDVTKTFTGGAAAKVQGSGTLVIQAGATASLLPSPGNSLSLEGRNVTNNGTFTIGKGSGLQGLGGARLVNKGTLVVNGESWSENHGMMMPHDGEAELRNEGIMKKTEGTGSTRIEWDFYNYRSLNVEVGGFAITDAEYVREDRTLRGCAAAEAAAEELELKRSEELFEALEGESGGGWQPRALTSSEAEVQEKAAACQAVTGAFSESQTDFSVGGRGIGLTLQRNYDSGAGQEEAKGIFGYGWSANYTDHLLLEAEAKRVTLVRATGAYVPFAEASGEAFMSPKWVQDKLSGSAANGYTLTLESQLVYKFSGTTGRLESITDRNGNVTTIANNGAGNPETITDPAKRTMKLAYNGEGLVETATDPMGHVTRYTYSGGNLVTVTQPESVSLRWQYHYNSEHQLNELTDARGHTTKIVYEASHRVERRVDALEHTTEYEYLPFEMRTKNIATGAVTADTVTSDAQILTTTRAYGTASATTETFLHDEASNLLAVTDGNGHTTKYTYNSTGDRLTMVNPTEHETKWTYDMTHDVLTTTLPNGETTTIKRNATTGNPETEERPALGGAIQERLFKYTTHGQVESITDPLKHVTKYEYNEAGDKTGETDSEGDKRTWGYNTNSQETTTVSPRGHVKAGEEAKYTTTTERDAHGWPIKITDPLKDETKLVYDGDGNLETKTDPELNVTTYTYDANNQRTKVKEASGLVTETGYDGAGQVTSQTDGNKHTTQYQRNKLEQITETIDPLGRKTTKEYDAAGNLAAVTDATKRITHYKYNPANRLTEITYSDGKTPTVKYEYNTNGDRTSMTDGTGTTTYEYDQLDRLTATKDGHGNTSGYEYNLANEQTKITYPNGKNVTRAYDSAGRLKSVTDWAEHTTKYAYDADSDLKATTFPTGTSNEDTYTYDETDAMKEVKMTKGAETLASLVYTRNKNGLVKGATSKGLPGEEKPAYTYDANSRLTKGTGIEYKYDEANNPTTIGTEHTYTYDAANQLEKAALKKVTANTYSYDEVGERTKAKPASGPATTYGYDQAGNLTSVERPKEGETPEIKDAYAYDGDGLRASQTLSGTTTYMAWQDGMQLPLLLSDGTNSYIYGPEGLPVEQVAKGGTVNYVHHDQQGSTRLLTSATGVVTATTTFDAYGNKTGSTGTSTTPLGYDAQYTNSDTGLMYLRARVYDPMTAQFLAVDSAFEATGAAYVYAADNPILLGDPTGLTPWSPRVKAAIAKCQSWKTWHSPRSPYYAKQHGRTLIKNACNVLLGLPPEVFGTGPHSGTEFGARLREERSEECTEVAGIVSGGFGSQLKTPGAVVLGGLAGFAFDAGCKLGA
jgi:RHS repeat-associated protein